MGVSIKVIQEMLGHSDTAVTLWVYGHFYLQCWWRPLRNGTTCLSVGNEAGKQAPVKKRWLSEDVRFRHAASVCIFSTDLGSSVQVDQAVGSIRLHPNADPHVRHELGSPGL